MATTGTEKHCRLCLMLNKGGTKACHSILLKRVEELTPSDHQTHPWTVHEFLKSKKNEILKSTMSKEKIQVLFPRTGVTDLTKWDLSLFCTVLTTYCGLKHLTRLDVERLRTLRNELCHMNDPHIDDVKYKDYFETIKVVATRILDNDNETKALIEKLLNDIHEGPLSLVETLKEMHTFYSMEMDIREKLEYVTDVDKRVLQKVEKFDELFERFDTKLEQIDSKLDHETSSKLHAARNNFLLPGVEIFFDLKNLSTEEEQRMSTVLEQLFEEVINKEDGFKSSLPADSYHKLREAVRKTFKLFLKRGWRITNARHECVLLNIRCFTFKSLTALFREHIHGQINMELANLSETISEMVGGNGALLETAIYKDEFWGVMDSTISAVEQFLTDQDCDTYPLLKEELQQHNVEEKHTLSLTARHVTNRGPHTFPKECGNELDTCLSLLKTELETEFHAPQVDIKASYKPKKTDIATHNRSFVDDQTTMPKEKDIEKNVPIEKKSGDEQDSCLDPFKKEYGKECDTQDRHVQDQTSSKDEYTTTSKDREIELIKELNIGSSLSETERETNIDPTQVSKKASHKPDKDMSSASTSMSFDVQSVLHEHQSKASVDKEEQDKQQTIALLELYKSQRAIAHYLELAYISFSDCPYIANKVYTTSQSARRTHLDTNYCGWNNNVLKIHQFMQGFVIDIRDVSEINNTISDAQTLKEETKYLQESYIELQDTIRNLTEHCAHFTSLHKEAKSHVKTMSSSEKSSEKELVHKFDELQSKIDIKKISSEKDTEMMYEDVRHEMKWMISESSEKQSIGKLEMKTSKEEELRRKWTKDEYWRNEETEVTKLLRLGYALTGGLSFRSYSDVMNLFFSVNRGEELETLTRLQKKETMSTEGAKGVETMQTQRIEALEKRETIRKQGEDDGGLECLKEVEKHLKYIDIQFERIHDCWSQLISALTLLKPERGLGTIYKIHTWERAIRLGKVWNCVRYLFWAYRNVSNSEKEDLYRFLSEMERDDLAEHRRELFIVIGKEISGAPVSRGSGKISDQRSDTDFKGKEKMTFGKGISGIPFSRDSGKLSDQRYYTDFKGKGISRTPFYRGAGKLSDQRSDTDFKGKEKMFFGKGISGTPFSLDSSKLSDQRSDTDFKERRTSFPAYDKPSDQQSDY